MKIEKGNVIPQKQPAHFSLAPKIAKNYGLIDAYLSIWEAKRKIRGLTSSPGAFAFVNGCRYKLFNYSNQRRKGYLTLVLLDGKLFINDFQKEGKKRSTLI